ncbi:hypothetical protein [Trinickia sp.]|uniref:hypothetical protein n=1 Tax=Trinickia sp. TaxID=2571163 RepID=UPI003F800432
MQTTRRVLAPASDEFAAWMRIGVMQAGQPRPLPVSRLDRHGLTAAVDEDVDLAPIGLPRRAMIACDGAPLCELRLVTRSVARTPGRATEVTMQPSRADDHTLLWQALRAHQLHMGSPPTVDSPVWPEHGERMAGAAPHGHGAAAPNEAAAARAARAPDPSGGRIGDARALVWCDTAFTMATHDDAWFFSHWLEYHFAEVRARTRMSCATADLRDMHTRIVDHEVEVRFLFESSEPMVRACTEAGCRWIAAEAARQIGMEVEHWLSASPSVAREPLAGWPRRATFASGARYSS